MLECIENQYNSILTHYDYLFKVLEKDKLKDKVVMLYSGFSDSVSQEEEEYIYNRYGIFEKVGDDQYVPFCDTFDSYLSQLYRSVIKCALAHEYGEDPRLWDPEIKGLFTQDEWATYVRQRNNEKRLFGPRASNCIIDQLYTRHYIILIEEYWDDNIDCILGKSLQYWKDELGFICQYVRNPEAHSRLILSDAEKARATAFCNEVIKRCKMHERELGKLV